jgi:hypothetical protein
MEKNQQIISVEPDVTIVVRAHGNLDVQGWKRAEVGIVTDINVQKIRHENKLLRLIFVEDCELSVPAGVPLIIDRVSDNARLRNLGNPLTINKVQGSLTLQNIRSVSVGRVSDACLIENVEGNVKLGKIGENLKGKNLLADISVERVSGNVKLYQLGGKVDIRSDENIEISLTDGNHGNVHLKASDSVLVQLPADPHATIKIKSGGEHIDINVGSYQKKIKDSRCEVLLAGGGQEIVIDSGDRVRVTAEVLDEKEILKLFEEVDQLWVKLKEESAARQAARTGKVHWEIKMVEGAAKVAQDTMEGLVPFAGQITEEAIESAEKHVQEALARVEDQIRNLGYEVWTEDDEPETTGSSDVTAEEKLIVMRLLEQQKISVEEADRLLRVLEDSSK